ncbi:hypothetical protein PG999_010779 [Apiospora kogelbergensis]|uniref:Uncharacterized protein n=1 Tax=Apiospora kogelbergensis TaxID=1337665 RepID=A0AAW0QB46_9PEZI
MAPCSESSSGWAIASPPRNPDLSGGRSSPLDFNPDIKSADAALQRISRAANGEGGTKYTREDIVDCFERIHRAAEHLVDGVEHERDQLDVRSEPDLCSSHNREQMQDDLDLVAMINVSQDILRTLRYVQDSNSNSRQQHQERNNHHHRRHSRNKHRDKSPVSPRQNIARGQKRKREQEQQGASHKKVCGLTKAHKRRQFM